MSDTRPSKFPPIATLGPLIALLIAVIFFATQSSRFLSVQNFSLILQQVMVVGTIAIGQTLIILTAGIDLSCGMVMALGGIVMSKLAVESGLNPYLAIVCGLLITMAFGLLNGLLVTRLRLPAFIVTLGTMNIAFALTQLYSNAQTISDLPPPLTFFGETFRIGSAAANYGTLLMLALYGLTWFALRDTRPGRHVYAVGNNPEATRLTGIPTDKVLLGVYVIAGLFYGIAALLSGLAHRRRRPERRTDREPRRDHRRRARRHQPVRRPRPRARLAARRGDRRRVPQRPDADGRAVGLPGADHRGARDPRGRHRSTFAQGSPLMNHHIATTRPRAERRAERRAAPKPARAPLGGRTTYPSDEGLSFRRAAPKPARAPLGGRTTYPSDEGLSFRRAAPKPARALSGGRTTYPSDEGLS